MSPLIFRSVNPEDLERCFTIESTAYEGDEAATKEKILTRIKQYPDGFLCLEVNGTVIGFINSGCANNVIMSDEDFKELIGHDPLAPNVVIMSVVVDPAFQGNGYATKMMAKFIDNMRSKNKATIHLMCKTHHIKFYEKLGYHYIKPSSSEHGGMQWHEMLMIL